MCMCEDADVTLDNLQTSRRIHTRILPASWTAVEMNVNVYFPN